MENTKYVLFSAVGGHDPTANYHDGPMLHICRRYRPEKVYIFLTAEMYQNKCRDDRYSYGLDRLGEDLGYYIKREYIEYPDFTDVHRFDCIKEYFDPAIERIHAENPDKTIVVNISSGTPAMKGYLLIKKLLSDYEIIAVQVGSPEGKLNPGVEKPEAYNREAEWELNEDRQENYYDRCYEERYNTIYIELVRVNIKSHIDAFDYEAAVREAKKIQKHLTKRAVSLLEAASARVKLDLRPIKALITGGAAEPVFGTVCEGDRDLFEYMLWLKAKIVRQDISDFVRGITPALYRLSHRYLRGLGIDIDKYTEGGWLKADLLNKDDEGRKYLNALNNKYNGFKDGYINSDICITLICEYSDNKKDIEKFEILREFESRIRNPIAHDIVKIDSRWMVEKTGREPSQIWANIEALTSKTLRLSSTDWQCYDRMNDAIKAELAKDLQ